MVSELVPLDCADGGAILFRTGIVNKNHNYKRQRFTILHELGHYITAIILHFNVENIIIYPYGGITKLEDFIVSRYNKVYTAMKLKEDDEVIIDPEEEVEIPVITEIFDIPFWNESGGVELEILKWDEEGFTFALAIIKEYENYYEPKCYDAWCAECDVNRLA